MSRELRVRMSTRMRTRVRTRVRTRMRSQIVLHVCASSLASLDRALLHNLCETLSSAHTTYAIVEHHAIIDCPFLAHVCLCSLR